MPAWASVGSERLPAGWSYPVGREAVDTALTAAGVRVGMLAFAVPEPSALGEPMLLDVRWLASPHGPVASRREPFERLVLRVWAAPEADLALVSGLLAGALAGACAWAAIVLAEESPAARRYVLTHAGGALHVLEG